MLPQRCVFHARTAANAAADSVLPLSDLATSDPAAYERALAKYDDTPERRRLRDTWIPLLEARWTEAVFLTPIHPHAIWRAWRDIAGTELPSQEFWAIAIDDVHRPVLFERRLSTTGEPIDPREVEAVDPQSFTTAHETTPRSADWIAHLAETGRRGAWFHGTPHVLTRRPVPVGSAQLIDWQHP
ncbi:hypothetical protein [Brachybacterium sp. AOP3-A1-3]|uniref:hypothetical protein n=1 Tax=Brachybacterium sp. AOP3-A1-3 TaxID=3457699 RepID=UPI004034C2BE